MRIRREDFKACGRPKDYECIYGDWNEKCISPRECEFKYITTENMKNDLTKFEKDLLKTINLMEGTKYNYTNLMEWRASEKEIKSNLREGELCFSAMGVYVAIKPTK